MTRRTMLGVIVAVHWAACVPEGDHRPILESQARDSAGITIVENGRPARDSRLGWRIGDAPVVSIGTDEGDEGEMLFIVLDATKLADGRIVVANAGTSELRVFGADGAYLEAWGGQGDGPGEFSAYTPETVSRWPGDSIVAGNMLAARVEIFDLQGNPGRTVTLADGYHSLLGVMPDGTMLVKPSTVLTGVFVAGAPLFRRDEEFGLLLPDGSLRVSLGALPGEEWFSSPAGPMAMPHPFGRSTAATIWGDLVVVAPTDRYELRAYRSDGTLVRIIRRDYEPRSPTQAELDAELSDRYADLPEERRMGLLAETADMPLVDFFPAFDALRSDPLGNLWVREYGLPGQDGSLWTVFDAEGRVQGLVETPPGLDVFEIGEDYFLGSTADEFDVERVQVWPLDRGG
ncbi:MAG: 6-bladed beta-propeller [Gammaproteobacteria bacterium]|nr:6-bladed beta-propeller [Gammaproteobacteria bacterium]MDE0257168.1 6-bladed beta-propeller [Gammaproteobacteria bacterium]